MKTLRIDHVTVVTPDAAGAQATFVRCFGLEQTPAQTAAGRALIIGDARIEFVSPAAGSDLAAMLAANGEGMAALCLEVASLDQARARLHERGIRVEIETQPGSRVLVIDPSMAHGVRLTLIERH